MEFAPASKGKEVLSVLIFIQESLKQTRNHPITFPTTASHLSGKAAKHPQKA